MTRSLSRASGAFLDLTAAHLAGLISCFLHFGPSFLILQMYRVSLAAGVFIYPRSPAWIMRFPQFLSWDLACECHAKYTSSLRDFPGPQSWWDPSGGCSIANLHSPYLTATPQHGVSLRSLFCGVVYGSLIQRCTLVATQCWSIKTLHKSVPSKRVRSWFLKPCLQPSYTLRFSSSRSPVAWWTPDWVQSGWESSSLSHLLSSKPSRAARTQAWNQGCLGVLHPTGRTASDKPISEP